MSNTSDSGVKLIRELVARHARMVSYEDVGGFALTDLEGLALTGEADISGFPCHRVSGSHPLGGHHEIFIEKGANLLRAVRDREASSIREEIREVIRVDNRLDSSRFTMPFAGS